MSDPYVTRLENYYLDIMSVRDGYEFSISEHNYPYSDRNELEHIGQKARRIDVRCIFTENPTPSPGWNEGVHLKPTYANHYSFIELLKSERSDLTFSHPKYGEIVGKVKTLTIDADDTINTARVSFTFWEHVTESDTTYERFVVAETAEEFREATDTLKDKYTEDEAAAKVSVSWTADATTYINTLNTKLSSITSPANSIIYQINYGTTTPGLILEALNKAIDRIVELYTTGRDAPASFINNLIVEIREFKSTLSGADANHVHIMGAARVAYETAVVLDEDDANRRSLENKEAARSFDAGGNYIKVDQIPAILTVNELDAMLAEVKTFIDEAVQIDRDYRSLQQSAAYLQSYVNSIKLDRERIETVTYNGLISMHLVALNAGMSYQSAERLVKLNPTIVNPNFAYGDLDVVVPAGT